MKHVYDVFFFSESPLDTNTQTRTQSLFMCFCGENVGLGARRLMGRDKVKSLLAPQPNPNLLSPPKHINSNWVLV